MLYWVFFFGSFALLFTFCCFHLPTCCDLARGGQGPGRGHNQASWPKETFHTIWHQLGYQRWEKEEEGVAFTFIVFTVSNNRFLLPRKWLGIACWWEVQNKISLFFTLCTHKLLLFVLVNCFILTCKLSYFISPVPLGRGGIEWFGGHLAPR